MYSGRRSNRRYSPLSVVAAAAVIAVSVTMSAMTSAMSVLMIAVTFTVTVAATFVIVVMLMVVTASAATTTTATAAASFATQTVHHALNLLVGCLAALHHLTLEVELHAGKRMIEIHCHRVVGHLEHVS